MGFVGVEHPLVARSSGADSDDALAFAVATVAEQIGPARRTVRRFLAARGVPGPIADDFQLVTSELVTNAVRHGRPGEIGVDVVVQQAVDVAVSVANPSPVWAIPPVDSWRPAPGLTVGGRGLGIVRRLSDAVEVCGDEARATIVCRRRWNGQEDSRDC